MGGELGQCVGEDSKINSTVLMQEGEEKSWSTVEFGPWVVF